jgi:hypothetical protein
VSKLTSTPYRVPSAPDRYDWYLDIAGITHPLPSGMPSWDYRMDLDFFREICLKSSEIRQECGFSGDTKLSLQVIIECAKSYYRELVWNDEIGNEDEEWHEIRFRIKGSCLTDRISLTTRIVLEHPIDKKLLTAYRGQSILHEETFPLSLHGTAPRFPTSEVSFSENDQLHKDALWSLVIGHEMDSPVSQGVQLFLNRDKTSFVNLIRENDPLTVSMLQSDVARQFLEHALSHVEFDPTGDYEDGSVGSVCRYWFQQIFSSRSREEAQEEMHGARFVVQARIQGMLCGGVK